MVTNDILLSLDSGSHVVLVLLDLSSAFIRLIRRLLLILKDRTVSVNLGDFSSTLAPLVCGVPQGSILGPLLFSL